MATDNYTKKTASLKAAKIDVRKLNVKGKDVVTHIGQKVHTCKDTRQVITENDLWGTYVQVSDKGEVIFHDDQVVNPNGDSAWNTSITKVEDNKAYVGDTFYGNIQTEKIKNGTYMFGYCSSLDEFSSDLSKLENGYSMFTNCNNLTTFDIDSDLSSLTNGSGMFYGCENLTSFSSDLSSLTKGYNMFCFNFNLTTFTSDLSSLVVGSGMFHYCRNLETFTSDLSSLVVGSGMFYKSAFETFTSDLSSLENGNKMFSNTGITKFTTAVPKLKYGSGMFMETPIETVICDMSELRDASEMFKYVLGTLRQLYVRFDNLISGHQMLSLVNPLDVDSFMYIADSINDLVGKGYATWDIDNEWWDYSDNGWSTFEYKEYNPSTGQIETKIYSHPRAGSMSLFYDSTIYPDGSEQANQILEYCQEIANKGWTVTLNGGRNEIPPTNVALIDGEQTVTPISYWYKPIPADERFATHVNANGDLMEIVGGRYIFGDNLSTYGQFTSLEEAEQAMGLTKYVRPEVEKKIK